MDTERRVLSTMQLSAAPRSLLLLLGFARLCLPQSTSISFIQPGNCSSSQYYSAVQFSCISCSSGLRSSDGLKCACPINDAVTDLGSPQVNCSPCKLNEIVSLDQRTCLTCDSSKCTCDNNDATVENLINNTYKCVLCTGGTRPNTAGDQCELCPPTYSSTCSCSASNEAGGLCLPIPKQDFTSVTLWESLYLYASYAVCKEYNNVTACQVLTNMVIMNVFSSTSNAYNLYSSFSSSNPFLPPVIYSTVTQLGTTAPTNLSYQKNAQIQFQVVKYDVRGNFLGWETLKGGTLQMCSSTQNFLDAAFKFGTVYNLLCSLQVADLFQKVPEPIFYELFLLYTSTSGTTMLWPVPVWNAGIAGTLGSRALRRFFLVDGISGRQLNLSSSPTYVTVATSLTLSVYLPLSPPSSEPPIQLTVQYEKQSLQAALQVSFAVTYTQSQGTYKQNTDIALGVLGSLAGILAIMETSSWLRRSGQQNIGIMMIIKFLAFLSGTLANTFFLLAYGIAVYWLIAFKGQTSVVNVTLPPAKGQVETDFVIYLSVAFSLKALELIHLLVSQLTYNIFLIDWEKPKDKTPSNTQGKSNVSIWRTILVANEWNEIQTYRKLSPFFQLFMVLLLLEVVGLKNIATKDLNLDLNPSAGSYQAPMSVILRFGMSASMWLAVGIVQVLFFIIIYERFFEDKIKQFVDLCSLSNVSVFILTHKCYGYYIHGRSVHGLADVSMETMLDNLRKEEENLCPLRGLEPSSDLQTFEVLLSERVREQYEKILQPLFEAPNTAKGGNNKNPMLQQRIKTYYTINRFLSCFLDHVYKDMDYIVKDKLLLESVLDMEFQQPIEKSIFYSDDRCHFSRTLFYSNELVLLLFDTLLFCVIDLGTQNFILATIITFVVQMRCFQRIFRSMWRTVIRTSKYSVERN
ncbi:meckelin-like isoform X2 [Hyla sarda]|uniref:meckelin-like isoform X2 n=1 Tax=Hyla sarda TaxID=327740 RepID=UPI0024C33DE7|nr:meckelin-like isoform X2 [Hyla sarda]